MVFLKVDNHAIYDANDVLDRADLPNQMPNYVHTIENILERAVLAMMKENEKAITPSEARSWAKSLAAEGTAGGTLPFMSMGSILKELIKCRDTYGPGIRVVSTSRETLISELAATLRTALPAKYGLSVSRPCVQSYDVAAKLTIPLSR